MASSPIPSPPPIASETRGGLLSKLQQSIAGLKYFVHGLAVAAGVSIRFNGSAGDAHLTYVNPHITSSKPLKVTGLSGGAGLVLPADAGVDFGTRQLKLYDVSGVPTLGLPTGAALELAAGKTLAWSTADSRFVFNAPVFHDAILVSQGSTKGIELNPGGTPTRKLYYDTATGYSVLQGNLRTDILAVNVRVSYLGSGTFEFATSPNDSSADKTAMVMYTGVALTRDGSRLMTFSNGSATAERVSWGRWGDMRIIGTGSATAPAFEVTKEGKLKMQAGDSSGTPGNATLNMPMGKSVIPAGASNIIITNNLINTTTTGVEAWIQQGSADATLHYFINRKVTAGAFELVGNAPATSNVTVWWRLIN